MKIKAIIFCLALLCCVNRALAQNNRQDAARAAAKAYLKAWLTFDFSTAKQYCTEDTWERLALDDSTFKTLPLETQQKKIRLAKTAIVENMQIIYLQDFDPNDKRIEQFSNLPFVVHTTEKKLMQKKTHEDIYTLDTQLVDGKWLVYNPLPKRRDENEYLSFRKHFNRNIEQSSTEYTLNGVDDETLIEISPYAAFGIKSYAYGKIENINGLNLYVVRYAFPQGDTCTDYEDRLYISNEKQLLPQKERILLGYYTEKGGLSSVVQAYWFDYDNKLHIRSQTSMQYNREIPYIVEYERLYDIDTTGIVLTKEIPDTLYCPQTYSQFKSLFPIADTSGIPYSESKRLAGNKFAGNGLNPEFNLYATGRIDNHQGYDLFFLLYTKRCQEPWAEGTYHNGGSVIGYSATQPDSMRFALDLGSSINSEGGSEDYSYRFNKDGSLSVTRKTGECCSATGFETEVNTIQTYRYSFIENKVIDEPSYVTSDFFDWQKLAEVGELPTQQNLLRVIDYVDFYVDTTKAKNAYFCFVSHDKRGNPIDSLSFYSNSKVVQKQIKANIPQTPIHKSDCLVKTGSGDFLIRTNGTFQPVKSEK